jgi:TetR/AcrR family transcriptional regulator, mexCD-oprJ operon repressor
MARTTDHRRATAERNVEAILDAAEALLARGAAATTTAVAAEAGVSRVTLYAHFPTREALVEAVVARAVERASAALDAVEPDRGPPLEALDRLVAAGWSELDRHRAMAQTAREHLGAAAMRAAHASVFARIAALVDRGRQEGAFRRDLPVDWLVTSCLALIHACGDEVRAGRLDTDEAPGVLQATMRSLFTGTNVPQ